jgi:hypothetical protein
LLILSVNIRLGAKNILSAKIKLRRAIYGLKIRDRSKIISGNINIFLVSI